MAEESCPACNTAPLGSQIVKLPHATTDAVSYGIICSNCGVVYRDKQAREQMEEMDHD